MNYREWKLLALKNAAAMVRDADLESLYGVDITDERDEARADRAQKEVARELDRRANKGFTRQPRGAHQTEARR